MIDVSSARTQMILGTLFVFLGGILAFFTGGLSIILSIIGYVLIWLGFRSFDEKVGIKKPRKIFVRAVWGTILGSMGVLFALIPVVSIIISGHEEHLGEGLLAGLIIGIIMFLLLIVSQVWFIQHLRNLVRSSR
jgi:uncharacterized membrane protein